MLRDVSLRARTLFGRLLISSMGMKKLLMLGALALAALSCGQRKSDGPVYLDKTKNIEERVEDALSRMTTEEKVALLHAQSKFSSAGVPRLGIPEVWCTDGPHGIRPEVLWDEWDQAGWTNDSCTAFPALSCLAATWDRDMSLRYGRAIGEEARYRKKDVLLGPGVNICRTPLNGRNFEYMGEDPYLAGQMVVPYVKGVQENNVAACVKHFAVNNQEVRRTGTSSNVDDRTLYEIYLPAFKAAVEEGGAWAIMGSYNLYNGQFNCHNKKLLCDILKGEWGYDGVVISDWGGARDDDEAVTNGLDMEYGTWTNGLSGGASDGYNSYHLARPYLQRLADGRADIQTLDDKARRVLRLIFRTNMAAETKYGRFTCPEHYQTARDIAAAGTVLLKNEDGVLPMDVPAGGRILVVGENAVKKMVVGGGSSNLKTRYEITPLEALQEAFAGKAEVIWERGYVGDTGTSYNRVDTGQDLSESRDAATLIADAVAAARGADYILFIGGLNKSNNQDNEGTDRLSLELPYGQRDVIEALAPLNPHFAVVNISGSPVSMPWADKVPAIVQGWYGGTESGHALVDVLTGEVNPSGKLPFTLPCNLSDGPLKTERQYPGVREEGNPYYQEYYDEGVFVGYRWYDSQEIPVQFAFGHGLSYTSFSLDEMKVSGRNYSVKVTNTGDRAGAEVVQFYIAPAPCAVARPAKELKGFEKVYLQPGESRTVTFQAKDADLAYFDAEQHKWVAEKGVYQVLAGTASDDIRTGAELKLNKTVVL